MANDWAIIDKKGIIFDGDEEQMRYIFNLYPIGGGEHWKEHWSDVEVEGALLLIQIHGRQH